MNTYVALLRGINVGGKTIKMDALKQVFLELGFGNVKTLLASGNVIFDSEEMAGKQLKQSIEEKFELTFGFPVSIILREVDYLQQLVLTDPFKNSTGNVKLYVSFLGEKTKKSLVIPYISPNKDFQIISMTEGELFSVLEVGGKTTDAMAIIEKTFGKNVTTRNWNTVKKISLFAK